MPEEEQTQTSENKNKESPKIVTKKNKKWIKVGAISFAVLSLIILVFYKLANPEFPLSSIIITGIIIIVFGALLFFGRELYEKFRYKDEKKKEKEDNELPKAKSPEFLFSIVKKQLEKSIQEGGFEENIHLCKVKQRRIKFIGGNQIIHFQIIPFYKQFITIDFVFNAHFEDLMIFNKNLSDKQILSRMNDLSINPQSSPTVEEFSSVDPLTGRAVTRRTTSPSDKGKTKKKKEEVET